MLSPDVGVIERNGQQIRNLLLISVLERCGVLGFGGGLIGSDPVWLDRDLVALC
jgi:hypothetical protein